MRITVPESIKDIELQQFQAYEALLKRTDLTEKEIEAQKINIFTGIELDQIDKIVEKDYNFIIEAINKALEEPASFEPFFMFKDVEFGFIPNLDKITAGEYRDLTFYSKEVSDMHKLMAVLFRPIKKKDALGNYKIQAYNGTGVRAEIMKHLPMNIVNGALVFFSSLANELIDYTQTYMQGEQQKEKQP
jgi:hypothetical protein